MDLDEGSECGVAATDTHNTGTVVAALAGDGVIVHHYAASPTAANPVQNRNDRRQRARSPLRMPAVMVPHGIFEIYRTQEKIHAAHARFLLAVCAGASVLPALLRFSGGHARVAQW